MMTGNHDKQEIFWFSDHFLACVLRIIAPLLLIMGWGAFGAYFLDVDRGGMTFTNFYRYSLLPFSAMILTFFVSAQYIQDIYALPRYVLALKYLFYCLFLGKSFFGAPILNISKGRPDTEDEDVNLLQRVGGPGWLYVEPGKAVLLEDLHGVARVVGSGFHFVKRHERFQEVFSLEDQVWTAKPILATSKDGIEVEVDGFQFGYRLCLPDGVSRRTVFAPYPVSENAVKLMAYNRSVGSDGNPMEWGRSVQFRIDSVITQAINTHLIEEILAPDFDAVVGSRLNQNDSNQAAGSDIRSRIKRELASPELISRIRSQLGTEILWCNIGQFKISDPDVDEQIRFYRLNAWYANLSAQAALVRAHGFAERIAYAEGGRLEKTASLLRNIILALKEAEPEGTTDQRLWSIVLARTAQVMETLTSIYGMDFLARGDDGNKVDMQ